VLVLLRQDGTFVAAFSAQGATREGIVEAAKEDSAASPARAQTERKRAGDEDEEAERAAWEYHVDADAGGQPLSRASGGRRRLPAARARSVPWPPRLPE
jgi:hypothetical protein